MFWFNKRLRAVEQVQEKIELTELFHKHFGNIGFNMEFNSWKNYKGEMRYDFYIIKESYDSRDVIYIDCSLNKDEFIRTMWIFKLGFNQWKNLSNKALDDKKWKKNAVKK